ncbi:MAG: hypothetical protein QXL98_02215 [Thermofilaceae archaeon]
MRSAVVAALVDTLWTGMDAYPARFRRGPPAFVQPLFDASGS